MLLDNKTKIIDELVKDLNLSVTGSYVAKKLKLNQKTVSNYFLQLEEEGILCSKTEGKNKKYSFNFLNFESVKNFILMVEHKKTISFYKNNSLIKEILEKLIPFVAGGIVVFGSYAKGNAKKDSDLDLLILGKCSEGEIIKLEKMFNKEINCKIYPNVRKFDVFLNEVNKNHVIIRGAEKFVEDLLWKKLSGA